VVAYKIDDDVAAVMEKNPAALGGDVDRWFDEKLEEVCKAATDKLAAGYDATYRVVEAEPNDAIHAEMEATASDLLVIGSSGHIGRVALHQIGYERYPVFMLRTE
jgi:nucleotide-binding universal stress UspA family protein